MTSGFAPSPSILCQRALTLTVLLSCVTPPGLAQLTSAPAPAAMKPDRSITIQVPVRLANFDPRAAGLLSIECKVFSAQTRSASVTVPLEGGSFNGTVDVRVDMGTAGDLEKATSYLCILNSGSPPRASGLPPDIAKFDKSKPLRTSVSGAIPRGN